MLRFLNSKTISFALGLAILISVSNTALSQTQDSLPDQLKRLSMEELMNVEVTSVSKRPEKLVDVASGIQVITREDIIRSAATSVPEALRLAPNLQVTQLNSRHWIISSRGFNNIFANKLLVMIDGRTVYSPLFAGVFWDAQNVLLEDVDRIEVISGPGGTLWGANAVNGVINIITRDSKASQGLFVSGAYGSALNYQAETRYGGSIGSRLFYKIYGQYTDRNETMLPDGNEDTDKWRQVQAGFQLDWNPGDADILSLQGNFYGGKQDSPNLSSIDGQNLMAQWTHNFSERSDVAIQAYADRTWRRDLTINDELATYDIDFQHHYVAGKRHNLVWGIGYRFMNNETWNNTPFVGLIPADRKMSLFSSFIQDEITILPDLLKFTIGSKLQHTDFTGFEVLPGARISWTPGKRHTVWSAISRAVRAPSRIDVDYHIPAYIVPPDQPSVAGGPNFVSEKVIAYELGYRVHPSPVFSLSLASFYNQYDDLYSVEIVPGTQTYQIQNGAKGYSKGAELSGNFQLMPAWRMRGGYTYFMKELKNKPGNINPVALLSALGTDAEHQFVLQSMIDLPENFKLDATWRYIDDLPSTSFSPTIKSYFNLDTRIGWQFNQLEFSIAGQNLLKEQHIEVGNNIPRGIYGKIIWRR